MTSKEIPDHLQPLNPAIAAVAGMQLRMTLLDHWIIDW